MRRRRDSLLAAALAALAGLFCLGELRAASSDEGEEDVAHAVRSEMETGIADAIAVLRDAELEGAEQRREFEKVLAEHIDFETVARLALGRAWGDLTRAQRAEFVTEFRTHLLSVGSQYVQHYRGEDVVITADRRETPRDWTVETQVVRPRADGSARLVAPVHFRLRQREDRWRIIDVRIAGISVVAGFRAQFESVMQREGIERVLEILRERNAARKRAESE